MGEWKDILEGIPEETFPASLEIDLSRKARSEEQMDGFLSKIRQFPQVEDVFCGKIWAEKLEFFVKPLGVLVYGATGLLGFLALLTAYHSTRLVLRARCEEMEICYILGATRLFTRIPFYMESIAVGALSGVIASVGLLWIFSELRKALPMPLAVSLPMRGMEVLLLTASLIMVGILVDLSGRRLALSRSPTMEAGN